MLPLQGIAQGSQPITSYNYGAGNADRVRADVPAAGAGVPAVFGGAVGTASCWSLRRLRGCSRRTRRCVAFTARALRIYCGALFLFGIQIACQMTFVSIGNAPCSIFVAVLRKFILLLPLIYLLPHLFSADPDDRPSTWPSPWPTPSP